MIVFNILNVFSLNVLASGSTEFIQESDIGYTAEERSGDLALGYRTTKNDKGERLAYCNLPVGLQSSSNKYSFENTEGIFYISKDGETFYCNCTRWYKLVQTKQIDLVDKLRNSNTWKKLDERDKSTISTMLTAFGEFKNSELLESLFGDIEPDLVAGSRLFKPFNYYVRVGFAILTIVLSFGFVLSMILDLAYMIIPTFRIRYDRKPKYISSRAYNAVRKIESGEEEGNTLLLFLKLRLPEILVFIIMLAYLAAGDIIRLFGYTVDLLRGIL